MPLLQVRSRLSATHVTVTRPVLTFTLGSTAPLLSTRTAASGYSARICRGPSSRRARRHERRVVSLLLLCSTRLPDWRQALSPPDLPPATPVVSVHYGGEHTGRLSKAHQGSAVSAFVLTLTEHGLGVFVLQGHGTASWSSLVLRASHT